MLFFEKSESNRTKMLLVMHVRSIYRVAHRYLGFGAKNVVFLMEIWGLFGFT